MGDRGSLVVRKDGEDSVVLFRHWGGSIGSMIELFEKTSMLAKELSREREHGPVSRGEPGTVMVLLCRDVVETDEDSAYLGKTLADGDDSDNGNYVIAVVEDGRVWKLWKDDAVLREAVIWREKKTTKKIE